MFGWIFTGIHTWWIGLMIAERHSQHTGPRLGIQHRVEDAMVETLLKPEPTVYVHWGAYESGKSWAARNAAKRLQAEGRLAMLFDDYHLTHKADVRDWLRASIGVPKDCADRRFGLFLPADRQSVIILDHPDFLIKQYGARRVVETLKWELGIPTLILVTSWEQAIELKRVGCKLLGEPGFGRWTPAELDSLWAQPRTCSSKKGATVVVDEETLALIKECGKLSGSPGILMHELMEAELGECNKPMRHRARLMNAEWENGTRALSGEDMQGVTGRFPDKDGRFHWDET